MKMRIGEVEGFLLEDMCIYTAVLVGNLLYDPVAWLFRWRYCPGYGTLQIIIAVVCVIQLLRKWSQWRYYRL